MPSIFFDFDISTGSSIQANALFDIFDQLTSIGNRKRSQTTLAIDSKLCSGRTELKHLRDP